METALGQRERTAPVARRLTPLQASLNDRIATIAELGAGTFAAERCAIAFQSAAAGDDTICASGGDSRWNEVMSAALGALGNRLADAVAADRMKRARVAAGSLDSIKRIDLSAREIDALVRTGKIAGTYRLAASAFNNGASAVRIAMVARTDRTPGELAASFELMARAVFGEMALAAGRGAIEFWRSQGAETGRQAVDAKRELALERAATNHLDDAVAAARRARPNERFGRFGELVAGGADFDQWIVAAADGGSLVVAASSSGPAQFDLGETSALAESFRRRIVITRRRDHGAEVARRDKQYSEDRMFSGAYVCIPFETGAIVLASRSGRASAARAEAIVQRLAPLASSWVMEQEISRRNALVRRLALRMFAAIDQERARIARDLHDDQAQLLAAAKIALEGRRDAARAIFRQLEDELRRKTRELRPATLGNASLDDAIAGEFARLNRAHIAAKLIHAGPPEKISRPVEQLCFQVVRETLSNVIRHARAKSVQVTIESTDSIARVRVSDNGRGINGRSEGVGLTGMRERLELMGGSLRIESRTGRTTVIAEIPESL